MVISMVAFSAVPASAQLGDLLNLLFPSPAAPPPPVEPAPGPAAPPPPAPAAAPAPAAKPADPRSQPFPIALPQIRRSPARNTNVLFEHLQPAVAKGIPMETALLSVVSPFPIAGKTNFSHDWGFPRYTPTPHLHKGTDVFADFGTPSQFGTGQGHRQGHGGSGRDLGLAAW